MGLGLGSVVWDATGGWSRYEITPLLQALPRLISLAIGHGWSLSQLGGSQGGVSNRPVRPSREYLSCEMERRSGHHVHELRVLVK